MYTLYRAIYGLVNNALKRGEASKVKILLSDGILNSSEAVKIQVMDNGNGLPENEDIFQWGASYSNGKGIGLALTRRIIEDHKGTITPITHFNDSIYKGACFTILLPKKYENNWLPVSKNL